MWFQQDEDLLEDHEIQVVSLFLFKCDESGLTSLVKKQPLKSSVYICVDVDMSGCVDVDVDDIYIHI